MELYRIDEGPFPGCPSYEALRDIYRTAQPPLPPQSPLDILKERDSKMFFPRAAIKQILNKPRISKILECKCKRCEIGRESDLLQFDALVDWVSQRGRIVLAILIYLGQTWLIKYVGGKADRVSDDNLEAVLGIFANQQQPRGLPKHFIQSYQSALYLFQPPTFMLGSPKLIYDKHRRFPYLNEEFVAEGSFGKVYKFEIHPDYLDQQMATKYTGWSAANPSCILARKVLKKDLTNEQLKMEEDMLRVIEKQDHPNIIGIIAFYSWRSEINFVFPFVERNLHTVLHEDWKPESVILTEYGGFPNNWLWVQILKVADALRTIHDPPKQPWPERGKIVGFHFDLKPGNILVKNDGTLLITDFGQSTVKLVQENDIVYGDYAGGDYGYQPPEVCPGRDALENLRKSALSGESSGSTLAAFQWAVPPIPQVDMFSDKDSSVNSPRSSTVSFQTAPEAASKLESSAASLGSSSVASTLYRVTATTNYDVWSLACIMLEVLVFIFKGGSSGIKEFEQKRRNEQRALSFHNGNSSDPRLKICVVKTLDFLRNLNFSGVTPQKSSVQYQSYLYDIVGVLDRMFNANPMLRISSDQVVKEFENIQKDHQEDDAPDASLIRCIKSFQLPVGFKEVRWRHSRSETMEFEPFYRMENVKYEKSSSEPRTVVNAKLQIFYKSGTFYIKVGYVAPDGPTCEAYPFSTSSTSYYPIYLYDSLPTRQNACGLKDKSLQLLLHFGSQEDLMAFQTVIMRYEPIHGLRITSASLEPYHGPREVYKDLHDPEIWPRCQVWKSCNLEQTPASPQDWIHIPSTPQRRLLVVFCGPQRGFFGIPLMDGKKSIRESRLNPQEESTVVIFKVPDDWNRYFYFVKPGQNLHPLLGAPAMPLSKQSLVYEETDKSRMATKAVVQFSDHKSLERFHSIIDETNNSNPHEGNKIKWKGP